MSVGEAASQLDPPTTISQLFRLMSDAALRIDRDTFVVQAANLRCEVLCGAHECELRGRPVFELLPNFSRECVENQWRVSSESAPIELDLLGSSGRLQRVSVSVIADDSTQPPSVILILKTASQAESGPLSELLLDEALEVAGVGWWSWNADAQKFHCSKSMLDLFNVPMSHRTNVGLHNLIEQLIPSDHDVIKACWHRATQLGETTGSEYRVLLPNGELRYLQSSARPITLKADGTSRLVVGMVRDVTVYARNRDLEQATRRELEKLNEVLTSSDGFVWVWNLSTQLFEYVSPNAERILGYPTTCWLNESSFFAKILQEEDRERVLSFCASRTQMKLDHTMEYRMVDLTGKEHWMRDHCIVKCNAMGQPTHLHGLMIDITERIKASELLQLGNERYQRLFYESPISLWELDCSAAKSALCQLQADGVEDVHAWLLEHPERAFEIANTIKILDVNRGTLTMFEANSADDFFQNIGGIFREESIPPYIGWLASLARGDESYDFENVLYSLKTGKRMICSIRSRVARGSEVSFSRTYSAVDNITDRKHTEQIQAAHRRVLELIAARRPLAQVAEALLAEIELLSPYLCATLILPGWGDLSHAKHFVGARFERQLSSMLGDVKLEYLPAASETLGEIVLHDLHQPLIEPIAGASVAAAAVRHALLDRGINRCAVVRIGSSDEGCVGTLLVMSSSNEFSDSLRDALKSFTDLAGVALEHAQAVGELMLRTAELQSVFDAYPDLLMRVSSAGDIVEVFGPLQMQRLLNVAEATTASLWDTFPAEIAERFFMTMNRIAQGSLVEVIEIKAEQDGAQHNVEMRFVGLANSTDQMIVARDTSVLKDTESKLRQMNHQFQRLFDQSPDAIFVETFDGIVLDANQAACELHQMERHELLGRSVFELVPPDEHERVLRTTPAMTQEGVTEFDGSSLRKDGVIVPISGRVSKIEFGGRPALLLHVRDISEQRRQLKLKQEQDRRMAHVSRLTMMGQLVAGIAHEIRQPLWSTNTFADVCLELLGQPNAAANIERIRDLMSKLSTAAKRANDITTRMLSFGRRGQPERTVEPLTRLVHAATELARPRLISANVSIRVIADNDLPDVECDRVLIEQTIVNLLNNACQALLGKEHGKREIEIRIERNETEAIVQVADNGPGLPAGVAVEQLFESFFTTERSGTGIGLALSRSFVEEHGGRIRAKLNPAGGMTFEFTLKLMSEAQTHAIRDSIHH